MRISPIGFRTAIRAAPRGRALPILFIGCNPWLVLFRCYRGDDFSKAWIAAQRGPRRGISFNSAIAAESIPLCGVTDGSGKQLFAGEIFRSRSLGVLSTSKPSLLSLMEFGVDRTRQTR